jgi:hypothetical protein
MTSHLHVIMDSMYDDMRRRAAAGGGGAFAGTASARVLRGATHVLMAKWATPGRPVLAMPSNGRAPVPLSRDVGESSHSLMFRLKHSFLQKH